jgi:small conductance mechanosensitive channel
VDATNSGYEIGEFGELARQVLESQGSIAAATWQRVRAAAILPGRDDSVADQAAGYAQFFERQRETDRIFDALLTGLGFSKSLGVDTQAAEDAVREVVAERAMNVSVFLELSLDEVTGLQAGLDALPADTELQAKTSIAEGRVRETAEALERVIGQMQVLDLDAAEYRAQLLKSTGAITADVFSLTVLSNLLADWGQSVLEVITHDGPSFVFQVLVFLLIIYVARKIAKFAERQTTRALNSSKVQLSLLLKRMIASTAGNAITVLGILVALSQLGISLGPLLAGLGIAGFVIGFALQDTLSNFASGMMILVYRPFDVGDVVDVGGVFGKVSAMSLVNTTMLTLDNQTIILPNNMIWGGVIKNLNEQRHRRVDLVFGVSYSDDIPKVERILNEIVEAHDKVLDDPEPMIKLHELADSSVNFVVRPWVQSDDYWDVYWDVMREVKMRFDAEGVSIPFPQRDVHLFNEAAAGGGTTAQPD